MSEPKILRIKVVDLVGQMQVEITSSEFTLDSATLKHAQAGVVAASGW